MNNLKNIIFDLGGVVLNLNYSLTVQAFRKYIPDLNEETFFGKAEQLKFFSDYEIGAISTAEFKSQFESHYGTHFQDKVFSDCWNAMILDFPLRRVELLRELRTQGRSVFLLSNINELHEKEVERKFSLLNLSISLEDLFHKVYYSHKISMRKPSEEIFNLVLKENDLNKEETFFIDDSLQHIIGAQKFGIQALHLKSPLTIENFFHGSGK